MNKAKEWIATDRQAVARDIARLGIRDAARYQIDLINDRIESGDARWYGITEDDMREALMEMRGAL